MEHTISAMNFVSNDLILISCKKDDYNKSSIFLRQDGTVAHFNDSDKYFEKYWLPGPKSEIVNGV